MKRVANRQVLSMSATAVAERDVIIVCQEAPGLCAQNVKKRKKTEWA